jgi:predicted RNA binding protein YcfA (HicA-like mRNA interferase family)
MSQREKLIRRICNLPADFSWDELVRLLKGFDYIEQSSGGSHRSFYNPQTKKVLMGLVKPHHPRKDVGRAYLRKVIDHLNLETDS